MNYNILFHILCLAVIVVFLDKESAKIIILKNIVMSVMLTTLLILWGYCWLKSREKTQITPQIPQKKRRRIHFIS
jgi:hypothetical protein